MISDAATRLPDNHLLPACRRTPEKHTRPKKGFSATANGKASGTTLLVEEPKEALHLHAHDLLVSRNNPVSGLHRGLECNTGFLHGDHDVGKLYGIVTNGKLLAHDF